MKDVYQPIENYGIIGDLNTIALVGLDGSIDFMCLPHFDSPTVFCALLDKRQGGYFQITSCKENIKRKQSYIPNTNILLTRFLFEDGIGEVIDFMPLSSFFNKNIVIRRVKNIKGKINYRLECCPRFNYGKHSHKTEVKGNGIFFHGEDGISLKLSSTIPMEMRKRDGYAEFTLKEGETADFILQKYNTENDSIASVTNFVDSAFHHTLNYWKDWVGKSTYKGLWQEMVIRSALTLKLLISEPYGAMVAAPTFGLPEKIGGHKNWDYRFVWIRDAAFAMHSLLSIGYTNEAESFLKWIQKIFETLKKNIKPFYRIDGTDPSSPRTLTHFEGYMKSSPITIGNKAMKQLQLDNYGEFIDAIYLCNKYVTPISYEMWGNITSQMNWLLKNWKRKDFSIWETRGEVQEFLYSRFMCWVAFDRAIKIGLSRSFPFPNSWIKERNHIFESVYKDFWNKRKFAFMQFKGSKNVDASCLLMPLVRFISPKDSQWLYTLKCVEENLVSDCMVYRYNPSESSFFGLKKGEGTFSACSFWYIECLSRSGQLQKAQILFDKMLSYANHVGLYSEQLGLQGEQLGNFPQAFTHLSLISAAYDLNKRLNKETYAKN